MTYVFVGLAAAGNNSSTVGDHTLTLFGQQVELTEAVANEAILGGCPLLTVEACEAVGLTADDFKLYPTPGSQQSAPAAFLEKRKQAWITVHQVRVALESGVPVTQPVTEKVGKKGAQTNG